MEITPFRSIGSLAFGDSPENAREKLASPFSRLKKGEPNEADAFDALNLHLYYDDKNHLEFVEAFGSADVTFRGVVFLGRDLATVIDDLRALGFSPTEADGYGVKFGSAGIALTAPSGIVEGVGAHRKNYYCPGSA